MSEQKSMLKQILTWAVVGILAIVAIKVAFSLMGVALGLVSFLLFTVAPIVFLGWLAVKGWNAYTKKPATGDV